MSSSYKPDTFRLDQGSGRMEVGPIRGAISADLTIMEEPQSYQLRVIEPVGMGPYELLRWYADVFTMRQLADHAGRLAELTERMVRKENRK